MPEIVDYNQLPDSTAALPLQEYTVKCLEVVQKPSKKHRPMDELKCEILAPDVIDVAGAPVQAAGRKFSIYISYDEKALRGSIAALKVLGVPLDPEALKALPIPSVAEVESGAYTEVPEIQDLTRNLANGVFQMKLSTRPQFQTDTGKWDGQPIRDENGENIITGHRIEANSSGIKSAAKTQAGGSLW